MLFGCFIISCFSFNFFLSRVQEEEDYGYSDRDEYDDEEEEEEEIGMIDRNKGRRLVQGCSTVSCCWCGVQHSTLVSHQEPGRKCHSRFLLTFGELLLWSNSIASRT